jgi:hypothetical protein
MLELLKSMQKDLLAKMDDNQAKMEADRKADQERADADRAQMQEMMKMLQAYQSKTDSVLPAIQVTETSHKETAAVIEPENEVETMACQGMEARPEEEKPTSTDRKPEAAKQRKAPAENATVMPVREPKKKRRRDQKLAAEHRRQKTKTSPRENCGPQERLAVTHRGRTDRAKTARKMQADQKMPRRATVARCMIGIFRPNTTRRSTVAWHRRNIFRKSTTQGKCGPRHEFAANRNMTIRAGATRCNKNSVGKNRTRWRQLMHREGKKETRIRDLEDQLLLGSKWEMNKTLRRGNEREIAKKINTSPTRLQRSKHWTLWKGRPPPKRKKGNGPYGRNRW